MENTTLKIASINHPPYAFLTETKKGVWYLSGGLDAKIVNTLKEKFRFEYEIVVPAEKEWGRKINGGWTGIIGMVYRNEVDLGISNLMITEDRYADLTVSTSYDVDGFVLISSTPRATENKNAVLQPFKNEVWLALFVSVLINTCFLLALQKIRSQFKWTPKLSWRNTLWNVVAAVCQEGIKMSDFQGPGAIYFIAWVFAAFVLQISYSGTLIGFLTFPSKEHSIANLQDLAEAIKERNFKIAYKKHSLVESLLIQHENYGSLFKETIQHPATQVSNHLEGFRRVKDGGFVFLANDFGSKYESYKEGYTGFQMHHIFYSNFISIVSSRRFKQAKDFNTVLRRFTEQGLVLKWRSDLLCRRLMETTFENKDFDTADMGGVPKMTALNILHLRGAFALLGIGYCFGIASLVTELLYGRRMLLHR